MPRHLPTQPTVCSCTAVAPNESALRQKKTLDVSQAVHAKKNTLVHVIAWSIKHQNNGKHMQSETRQR